MSLVDEDVPQQAARFLRKAGCEALLVAEVLEVQTDGSEVWGYAVPHRSHWGHLQSPGFSEVGWLHARNPTDPFHPPPNSASRMQEYLAPGDGPG